MSDLSLPLLRISIVIAMIFGASAGRASQLQLSSSAVSITATPEPDLYLIADYSKILLFDKHHGSITPMAIVGATRRNVPTGLAYDSQRNRLFIANYLSNNILVAIVDLPAKTITVEEEFAADQVISRKNISIDPDTGAVAVADYDGNDVQIWTQDGAAWRRELLAPALRVSLPSAVFEKAIVASLSSLGEFTEATNSCAAEACDQEQLCQIADAAIDQINTGSELRLGTLISAAMLNPCVGRHFIARSAVH